MITADHLPTLREKAAGCLDRLSHALNDLDLVLVRSGESGLTRAQSCGSFLRGRPQRRFAEEPRMRNVVCGIVAGLLEQADMKESREVRHELSADGGANRGARIASRITVKSERR